MKKLWLSVAAALWIAWSFVAPCLAEDAKRIAKEELKNMLSDPSVSIVDVRSEVDWKGSRFKIKGAVRESPNLASWMGKYAKNKPLVFYCA